MRPKFLRSGRIVWFDWAQLALFVWVTVVLVVCIRTAIQPRTRSLFYTYAGAGADWISGSNLYFHSNWPTYLDQFRYSPLVAVGFTPLTLLDERLGNVLWRLFNAGVFLGGWWWWLRTVLPDPRTRAPKAIAFLLVAPLALASMNNGQTNPLVIGFLLMATAALSEKRWTLAALFITFSCALKLYPIAVGLLLVTIYPRQLSWRLALTLLVAALLPFCFQRPAYVLDQYQQWANLLGHDERKGYPLNLAYRDLWLLFRVVEAPVTPAAYLAVQIASGIGCAILCVAGHWVRLDKTKHLTAALMLGSCWMTLCGPATESSSFIQLAPALAWALIAAQLEFWPIVVRWLPAAGFLLLMIGVTAGLTPWTGQIHGYGEQPLGTLLLFVAYVAVTIRVLQARHKAAAPVFDLRARAA